MRWGALFDDLEAQLAAAGRAALESEVGELVRAEQAGVSLVDRLRAHGGTCEFRLRGGLRFRGRLAELADEWCIIESRPRRVLAPLGAVAVVCGLGRESIEDSSVVRRSLGIRTALRGLARDRSHVLCHLDGGAGELFTASGMLDVVGRDYFELVTLSDGASHARTRTSTVVPLAALVAIVSPA